MHASHAGIYVHTPAACTHACTHTHKPATQDYHTSTLITPHTENLTEARARRHINTNTHTHSAHTHTQTHTLQDPHQQGKSSMTTLRFVTWNVRGVGSYEKRLKVLNHLNNLQADIVLLQETHIPKTEQKLSSPHFPHISLASYNSKQRGVAILINRKINLNHISSTVDPEGRYVIINISIHNKLMYCQYLRTKH